MKGILLLSYLLLGLQQPAPPPPPRPNATRDFERRFTETNGKLKAQAEVNVSARRAIEYSRRYLNWANQLFHSGHQSQADRVLECSIALLNIAEHQKHLRMAAAPAHPDPAQIREHLQRVYFRTQQADFFFTEAHDTAAGPLVQWARDFYQLAVRSYDRKDWVAADENAKCSEEVTKALESLAQAASLPPIPPQPPSSPAPPFPPARS